MTEIRFYHLQRARLEDVLPTMLERAHARGQRALVALGSAERVEALAAHLWTYRTDSFLPHGTIKDGDATRQPIFLTDQPGNPNEAQLLLLCDGASRPDLATFDLVCELFDGNDETTVTEARGRWRDYKAAGHTLIYFQQNDTGRWEEKARA
jgi:DNA polymerase-3 subunit chi